MATTRNAARPSLLRTNGADDVVIDTGSEISTGERAAHPEVFDKVLELVDTTTLIDSLACARQGGVVCMTGIAGNA